MLFLCVKHGGRQVYITVKLQGSNSDGSFTRAVLNLFLSPLQKNPIAAVLG